MRTATNNSAQVGGQRRTGLLGTLIARLSADVDHARVLADLQEQGTVSGRYILLTVLSAAIATLGLLLSSPAVIIGAMLVSPLMGPIILLGLSFLRVDWPTTRRAVTTLAIGFALAFAVAALLTWVSPLKDPTAEILARTRPNLFDLLVAIFSGVAGGYAIVSGRGETVIGVAIATALMPPVAAVGFGAGIGDATIALGALLLFVTNLIAIALAAAVVAALFGFHGEDWKKRGWVGNLAILAVLAALCVPLTLSLQTIATESHATTLTRQRVEVVFGPRARLTALTVRDDPGRISVGGLVATPKFIMNANADLKRQLTDAMGRPVDVGLEQLVLAHPERFAKPALTSPTSNQTAVDPARQTVQALRDAVPFSTAAIAYDSATGSGLVLLAGQDDPGLHAARLLEAGLRARDGLSSVTVVPPVAALAPVPLTIVDKAPVFGAEFDDAAWALTRWRVSTVRAHLCMTARAMRDPVAAGLAARLKNTTVNLDMPTRAACRARAARTPSLVFALE